MSASASRVAARYLLATAPVTDINAKFKAAFPQVKNDPKMLDGWLTKAWEWYNKKYAGGSLRKIPIRLQRNTKRPKALGQYGRMWISIHPRALMVGVDLVLHILKHEMCHQAVWEVDHVNHERQGSDHGPVFFKWAEKFGVMGRYADIDGEDQEAMKTLDEKYEDERKKKLLDEAKATEKPLVEWTARAGTQAKFMYENYWVKGVLVRPIGAGRWWFVSGYDKLWRGNTSLMFELKPEERVSDAEAKLMIDRATNTLEAKDDRRNRTREIRQQYRNW